MQILKLLQQDIMICYDVQGSSRYGNLNFCHGFSCCVESRVPVSMMLLSRKPTVTKREITQRKGTKSKKQGWFPGLELHAKRVDGSSSLNSCTYSV